ncbi:MAG: SDR family oxidoreductase [Myxococcota bacterium]
MSVSDTLRGRHLIVTGVTGFLGKVWLAHFLDHLPEIGKLTILVRGQKQRTAEERFLYLAERSPAFRTLRNRLGARFHELLDEKVEVITANVSAPLCGIDEETLDRLVETADAVLHFAGLTDFEPDPPRALDANVHGALHAADLAARLKVPRLIHTSTAFVTGTRDGEVSETLEVGHWPSGLEVAPKAELTHLAKLCEMKARRIRLREVTDRAAELGFPNIYTYTKALAEHLLAQRTDIELTTIRPAIVECALAYPFRGWNEGVNTSGPICWLLSTWFRRFPAGPHVHFDIVPVDTVARATTLITARALHGEARDIYQLGSGHKNPLYFERAIELNNMAIRRHHGRKEASAAERFWMRYCDAIAADPDKDRFPTMDLLKRATRGVAKSLKKFDAQRMLPPAVYEKHGEKLDERLRTTQQQFVEHERTLKRIEAMLKVYRPFIYDYDFVFRTDHMLAENELLGPDDATWVFDIEDLDWRDYWVNVHYPGLAKWTIPFLRGERVPDDPPFIYGQSGRVARHDSSAPRAQGQP